MKLGDEGGEVDLGGVKRKNWSSYDQNTLCKVLKELINIFIKDLRAYERKIGSLLAVGCIRYASRVSAGEVIQVVIMR